jgi:hypothetical protein
MVEIPKPKSEDGARFIVEFDPKTGRFYFYDLEGKDLGRTLGYDRHEAYRFFHELVFSTIKKSSNLKRWG